MFSLSVRELFRIAVLLSLVLFVAACAAPTPLHAAHGRSSSGNQSARGQPRPPVAAAKDPYKGLTAEQDAWAKAASWVPISLPRWIGMPSRQPP